MSKVTKKGSKKVTKKNIFKMIGGFTLIELLATIAVLAIVSGVVIYTALNVINTTKSKSYDVSINNIEKNASSYALENSSELVWLTPQGVLDGGVEYYCVSMQDLIDTGYFKGDVLESKISDTDTVSKDDLIYLERDSSNKTIVRNILLTDSVLDKYQNFATDCGKQKGFGTVAISVSPLNWSKFKTVTINYKILNNTGKLSDYIYSYDYEYDEGIKTDILPPSNESSFDSSNEKVTLDIYSPGTLKAKITKDEEIIDMDIANISKIDNQGPELKVTIDCESGEQDCGTKYSKNRTATIQLIDGESGFDVGNYKIKYDWSTSSKSCDELSKSETIKINSINGVSGSVKVNIDGYSGAGKLYVCGENITDYVGNSIKESLVSTDMYLDNTRPVITLGEYSGKKEVQGSVTIPIKVTDVHSGVDSSSFTSSDVTVSVGNSTLTSGVKIVSVDENSYNLEIVNGTKNGAIRIVIDADKVSDKVGNKNSKVEFNPDIVFNNIYTISLNSNGGTTTGTTKVTATYNSSSISPSAITLPTREYTITYNTNGTGATSGNSSGKVNYTFNGWYTATSGGSKVITNSSNPSYVTNVSGYTDSSRKWIKASDVTLYAQWTAIETTLATITKTGYTCTWNTKSNGTGDNYASGARGYVTTDNVTLYAKCTANTYTINYYTYDGKTKIGSSEHTYNVDKNLTTMNVLGGTAPNNNVSFYGWSTSANNTSRTYTDGQSVKNLTTNSSDIINLYAIWRSPAVKITYKSGINKATSKESDTYYYYNANTSVSIRTETPTSISNWTTLGWRDDTTAGAKEYNSATNTNFSASVTLYAVYSRTYTANFYSGVNKATTTQVTSSTAYYNSNSGATPTKVSIKIPTAETNTNITNWTESGYRDDTTAGAKEYNFNTSVDVAWGTNFHAVYSRTYTANFYSGVNKAKKTQVTSSTAYYNSNSSATPTKVSIKTPTAETNTNITNWTELGYRDDTTVGAKEYNFNTSVDVAWGTNFHAVYSRTLTITYNGNGNTGGSTANTTKTVYLNSNSTTTSSLSVTLANNGFSKSGFRFNKWAAGSTGGTKYAAGASYTPSLSYNAGTFGTTMYATWTETTFEEEYGYDKYQTTGSVWAWVVTSTCNRMTENSCNANSCSTVGTIPSGKNIYYVQQDSLSSGSTVFIDVYVRVKDLSTVGAAVDAEGVKWCKANVKSFKEPNYITFKGEKYVYTRIPARCSLNSCGTYQCVTNMPIPGHCELCEGTQLNGTFMPPSFTCK